MLYFFPLLNILPMQLIYFTVRWPFPIVKLYRFLIAIKIETQLKSVCYSAYWMFWFVSELIDLLEGLESWLFIKWVKLLGGIRLKGLEFWMKERGVIIFWELNNLFPFIIELLLFEFEERQMLLIDLTLILLIRSKSHYIVLKAAFKIQHLLQFLFLQILLYFPQNLINHTLIFHNKAIIIGIFAVPFRIGTLGFFRSFAFLRSEWELEWFDCDGDSIRLNIEIVFRGLASLVGTTIWGYLIDSC